MQSTTGKDFRLVGSHGHNEGLGIAGDVWILDASLGVGCNHHGALARPRAGLQTPVQSLEIGAAS